MEKDKNFDTQLHDPINNMLNNLEDIDGLDTISWWPIAPIWWVLIISILTFIILKTIKTRLWDNSWKRETIFHLKQMKKSLNSENGLSIAIELSETLKRVAIHKFSRQECAALEGDNWIKLLEKYDRKKFNWQKYDKILTKDIYGPSTTKIAVDDLKKLINATKNWVK